MFGGAEIALLCGKTYGQNTIDLIKSYEISFITLFFGGIQMCKRTNLKNSVVISVFWVALVCATAAGRTIYVDDDATGANNGSSYTICIANKVIKIQMSLFS